jgi:NACalpha-BTF3-like transcription factor
VLSKRLTKSSAQKSRASKYSAQVEEEDEESARDANEEDIELLKLQEKAKAALLSSKQEFRKSLEVKV